MINSDEVKFDLPPQEEPNLKEAGRALRSIFYHLERLKYYHDESFWEPIQSDRVRSYKARSINRIEQTQGFVRVALQELGFDPTTFIQGTVQHAIRTANFDKILSEKEANDKLCSTVFNTQDMIRDKVKFCLYDISVCKEEEEDD